MKTRIIVAVVGIPLLLAIIFLCPVWLFAAFVGLISALSAWELMSCAGGDAKTVTKIYTSLAAFCIPVLNCVFGEKAFEAVLFLLFAAAFGQLMLSFRDEEPMRLETVLLSLLGGAVMPLFLSALVRLGMGGCGAVCILLPFVITFSCDSGAYFAGVFLGKHKLAPKLSPKKTIEGSIGGFAAAILLSVVYGIILNGLGFRANLLILGVYGFIGGLACQLGDLCFSAIKRIYGVKDYGNLLPGHGGALDRFDSIHWVAPLVWLLMNWVPAIEKLG